MVSGCHGELPPGAWSPSAASGKVASGSGSELKPSLPPSKPPAPTTGPLLPGLVSLKKILRDFLERAIRERRRPARSRRLRGSPARFLPARNAGSQEPRTQAASLPKLRLPPRRGEPFLSRFEGPVRGGPKDTSDGPDGEARCTSELRRQGASQQPAPRGPRPPGAHVASGPDSWPGGGSSSGWAPVRCRRGSGNQGCLSWYFCWWQREREGFLEERPHAQREAPREFVWVHRSPSTAGLGLAGQTGGEAGSSWGLGAAPRKLPRCSLGAWVGSTSSAILHALPVPWDSGTKSGNRQCPPCDAAGLQPDKAGPPARTRIRGCSGRVHGAGDTELAERPHLWARGPQGLPPWAGRTSETPLVPPAPAQHVRSPPDTSPLKSRLWASGSTRPNSQAQGSACRAWGSRPSLRGCCAVVSGPPVTAPSPSPSELSAVPTSGPKRIPRPLSKPPKLPPSAAR